jgi:hypothetical protein
MRRMVKLSYAMTKVLVDAHGPLEFLRRISDPLWFQAFGCVLGFDWHSSGVTTVVTGVLKQSLSLEAHGIAIAGGKGKKSTSAIYDIPKLAEILGISTSKTDSLLYASKMSAKVDSAAVQDGYSLYHHAILFDESANWAVVQQGMNVETRMARRYHWVSDTIQKGFIFEPHAGIICEQKTPRTLDMTARESQQTQDVSLDLVRSNPENLRSSVCKLMMTAENTLDHWISEGTPVKNMCNYEMPRRLDWNLFKRMYDLQPKNYEEILSTPGVGAATVRALALVSELIYGTPASWQDPVKYSFAHGGKDGVPYPVARKVYDQSIEYLEAAIDGSELDREERTVALRKLAKFSETLFSNSTSEPEEKQLS